MPYYIYKISSGDTPVSKTLELIKEYDSFRDAKKEVKTMRAEQSQAVDYIFKVIFADSQPAAEELLLEHREQPIVKEWEK